MPAIRENFNKTKFYVPDLLVCKIKPDPELAMKVGIHRGTPIGKISELYPLDLFKKSVVEEAQKFIYHMTQQGNELQTSIYEMELWGPYRDKPTGSREVNIEEGNPWSEDKFAFTSKGTWQPETLGPQNLTRDTLERGDFRHGVCFRIRGKFVKTRGHQEETTGVVIL